MLVSYNWLKAYLPKLPKPEKLAEALMLHGMDVESMTNAGDRFAQVVVGEIVGINPHPNADKLRLADVMIEPKGEPQEIVCGAPNIEVGQKVPVALLGATLPNGLTIEPRAIRGVTSNGMLCARDELGLGEDHTGILVLDPKAKVGSPLAKVLGEDDVVFDVTTPANRADLMSMRGMAWEIGAMLGQKPKFPAVKLKESQTKASASINVAVSDEKLSPLYTLRVIRGVRIGTSPDWIQQRLRAAGMRPINAVVDATNYIMLEYGQPLHAFDASKISGHTMSVRAAKANESMVTLDGKTRQLDSSMIMIADEKGAVAIAGVMGGQATEVSDATTDIYLESAIFNPVHIRKTSRQLGLVSEASKRFEKGLWPALAVSASEAAAALIVELCGGTVEQGSVIAGGAKAPRQDVKLDPQYITERLGQKISSTTSKKVLTALGFKVSGTKTWTVSIPEWRLDVSIPEDIVDEVGRMVGYEDLPKVKKKEDTESEVPNTIRFKTALRQMLVELGFTEIVSHAFFGGTDDGSGDEIYFVVANPLDKNQQFLRDSLLLQMESVLRRAADAGHDAMIFEIGHVFNPVLPGPVQKQQPWKLAIGIAHKGEKQIRQTAMKLQQKLEIDKYVEPDKSLSESSSKVVRGRKIEAYEYDIWELTQASQKDFSSWGPMKFVTTGVRHKEQSKYPAVKRDIAFWWPGEEAQIAQVIDKLKIPVLQSYEQKDTFTKDSKTSYAYTFVYQSFDRTLTKAEVDILEQKIKDALMKQGAEIR